MGKSITPAQTQASRCLPIGNAKVIELSFRILGNRVVRLGAAKVERRDRGNARLALRHGGRIPAARQQTLPR